MVVVVLTIVIGCCGRISRIVVDNNSSKKVSSCSSGEGVGVDSMQRSCWSGSSSNSSSSSSSSSGNSNRSSRSSISISRAVVVVVVLQLIVVVLISDGSIRSLVVVLVLTFFSRSGGVFSSSCSSTCSS